MQRILASLGKLRGAALRGNSQSQAFLRAWWLPAVLSQQGSQVIKDPVSQAGQHSQIPTSTAASQWATKGAKGTAEKRRMIDFFCRAEGQGRETAACCDNSAARCKVARCDKHRMHLLQLHGLGASGPKLLPHSLEHFVTFNPRICCEIFQLSKTLQHFSKKGQRPGEKPFSPPQPKKQRPPSLVKLIANVMCCFSCAEFFCYTKHCGNVCVYFWQIANITDGFTVHRLGKNSRNSLTPLGVSINISLICYLK